MPFGFVDTARTFAGISVVAAPSTFEFNGIQLARADHWVGGGSSSVFFARTHELLQYHFRTVALAFEYDKDGRASCRAPRGCSFLGWKGSERSRNIRGVFRPNRCAFSEPRPHRFVLFYRPKPGSQRNLAIVFSGVFTLGGI
jgi:hypothetical protein